MKKINISRKRTHNIRRAVIPNPVCSKNETVRTGEKGSIGNLRVWYALVAYGPGAMIASQKYTSIPADCTKLHVNQNQVTRH
jgi:hypothetical protein